MSLAKLITIIFLISQSYHLHSLEILSEPNAASIISQWFSIDSSFDNKLQKTLVLEDKKQKKFTIYFTSDDQQPVNGLLVIPNVKKGRLKLALLLHAMGSDQSLW
ncbi:MAG: hypothetical protein JKY19_01495, partial [Alcanivoracaceae bacterium]|nr:hypothetical protein [Alcanivoracaceae bacterium]